MRGISVILAVVTLATSIPMPAGSMTGEIHRSPAASEQSLVSASLWFHRILTSFSNWPMRLWPYMDDLQPVMAGLPFVLPVHFLSERTDDYSTSFDADAITRLKRLFKHARESFDAGDLSEAQKWIHQLLYTRVNKNVPSLMQWDWYADLHSREVQGLIGEIRSLRDEAITLQEDLQSIQTLWFPLEHRWQNLREQPIAWADETLLMIDGQNIRVRNYIQNRVRTLLGDAQFRIQVDAIFALIVVRLTQSEPYSSRAWTNLLATIRPVLVKDTNFYERYQYAIVREHAGLRILHQIHRAEFTIRIWEDLRDDALSIAAIDNLLIALIDVYQGDHKPVIERFLSETFENRLPQIWERLIRAYQVNRKLPGQTLRSLQAEDLLRWFDRIFNGVDVPQPRVMIPLRAGKTLLTWPGPVEVHMAKQYWRRWIMPTPSGGTVSIPGLLNSERPIQNGWVSLFLGLKRVLDIHSRPASHLTLYSLLFPFPTWLYLSAPFTNTRLSMPILEANRKILKSIRLPLHVFALVNTQGSIVSYSIRDWLFPIGLNDSWGVHLSWEKDIQAFSVEEVCLWIQRDDRLDRYELPADWLHPTFLSSLEMPECSPRWQLAST